MTMSMVTSFKLDLFNKEKQSKRFKIFILLLTEIQQDFLPQYHDINV